MSPDPTPAAPAAAGAPRPAGGATTATRRRLGDVLVDSGLISPDQLVAALDAQRAATGPRRRLGQVVTDLGFATEKEVADRLAWMEDHFLKAGIPQAVIDGQLPGIKNGPAVGTPEQIVDHLSALEAAGMTYAITYFAEAAYDLSGIELFEREVIPALVDARPQGHHHRWHLPGRH